MNGKEIGKRIADLRKSFKMTKRFVADTLGIAYSSVCAYEYGKRIPSDETKKKLAKLFGTSVEQLFYTEENHEML